MITPQDAVLTIYHGSIKFPKIEFEFYLLRTKSPLETNHKQHSSDCKTNADISAMQQIDWIDAAPKTPLIDYPHRTLIGEENKIVNMGGYWRVTTHLYQHDLDPNQIDHEVVNVKQLKADEIELN
jgi:hypothetical protein